MLKTGIVCILLVQFDALLGALIMLAFAWLWMRMVRLASLSEWILHLRKHTLLLYLLISETLRLLLFIPLCEYCFVWFSLPAAIAKGVILFTIVTAFARYFFFYRHRDQILKESGINK